MGEIEICLEFRSALAWDGPASRPAMPVALLATQGVFYGLIGNPMGPIARWRAALVRPAPRQSAPGAMVGQVRALGAVSGGLSALGAISCYFQRAWRLFGGCVDSECRYFCAEGANWRNSFS